MVSIIDFNGDNYLLISGIQHFVFCRRQWALIHIEQQWDENFFTIDGQIKHEKVDTGDIFERKKDIKLIRSMPIISNKLKIQGKCDVVELQPDEEGAYFSKYDACYNVYPIEYKRGKPKHNDSDIMQLLAQAICLEEMLGLTIEKGACFYFETRRREEILFTSKLRNRLVEIVGEMNQYYDRKYTPNVKKTKKCKTCSLRNLCLPELEGTLTVAEYMQRRINE